MFSWSASLFPNFAECIAWRAGSDNPYMSSISHVHQLQTYTNDQWTWHTEARLARWVRKSAGSLLENQIYVLHITCASCFNALHKINEHDLRKWGWADSCKTSAGTLFEKQFLMNHVSRHDDLSSTRKSYAVCIYGRPGSWPDMFCDGTLIIGFLRPVRRMMT